MRIRHLAVAALAAAGFAASAPTAQAAPLTQKKSIWGPVTRNGVSQFPIYRDLGAGIYQMTLGWLTVATARPVHPTDPNDPAYRWPAELDRAVAEARRYGIRVCIQVQGTPGWANGGRSPPWVPTDPQDYANFVEALSRRYPDVRLWMIWGEPSRRGAFQPIATERRGRPLLRSQTTAPRNYARLLDAAYGALKRVSPRNLVIGGNTFTVGDISPRNWIIHMRLPNGRRPRLDMYGHNPFTARRPNLANPHPGPGRDYNYADFSDLDVLTHWLDANLRDPRGRRLPLFLSEFFFPTDHFNWEFPFYVTRATQARWLADALRITRRWSRIYTLGWFSLYDDPPRPRGDEVNRGLLDRRGRRKPAYYAFRRG